MDHYTVAAVVATTCIVFYTIFYITTRLGQRGRLNEYASKFPGPPTLPIFRHARFLIGSDEAILKSLFQIGKLYPSPYRFWAGNYLLFAVNTPEQLKVVLHSPKTMDKGPLYDYAKPWLGAGLLTASEGTWRVHRKLMQPAFNPTVLQSYIEIFTSKSATIAKEMEENVEGPEFEIYKYISKYSLHTICANDSHRVLAGLTKRVTSPWLFPNFIFERTQHCTEQQKFIKYLNDFTHNVIQTRKKKLLERSLRPGSADCKEDDTSTGVPRRKILLDHLLEVTNTSERLSDKELHEEVATMIVTGSDTTAAIISHALLMLSSHPEIQEKVYRELYEIYGEADGKELRCTPEDLTRMTHMSRVIKETIRLFPVAPCITRLVAEDLDIGEHTLPKESLILICLMDLHRNEKYWPDPLKFDPDRFLPEEVEKREPYSYLPFSGGPRSCIGFKYAMMSMKILLATILRKYVLKKDTIIPVKDIRLKWEIMLKPIHPITLRIEKRTKI